MDYTNLEILKLISERRVSGESIAKKLNISRVAVWKRIKRLQKLGYKIDITKSGYKLVENPDKLIPFEVKKHLKTKYIGNSYIYLEECVSTNLYLKKNKKLPNGTVAVAEKQSAGRGRKGRQWVSPKYKGIYFSLLLKKSINITDLPIFSLIFPLAVMDVLRIYTNKKVYIKWPNDVYIENKKISGILLETEIEGNDINSLVVGIGININTSKEELGELTDRATSLFIEEGKIFNRSKILAEILNQLETNIENFSKREVIERVNKNLLWKNENVKILDTDIEGRLLGIDQMGGLVIETDKGQKTVYNGDLSLRNLEGERNGFSFTQSKKIKG